MIDSVFMIRYVAIKVKKLGWLVLENLKINRLVSTDYYIKFIRWSSSSLKI